MAEVPAGLGYDMDMMGPDTVEREGGTCGRRRAGEGGQRVGVTAGFLGECKPEKIGRMETKTDNGSHETTPGPHDLGVTARCRAWPHV